MELVSYRAWCACGWERSRCTVRSIAEAALAAHAPRDVPNDRHWQAFRGRGVEAE